MSISVKIKEYQSPALTVETLESHINWWNDRLEVEKERLLQAPGGPLQLIVIQAKLDMLEAIRVYFVEDHEDITFDLEEIRQEAVEYAMEDLKGEEEKD